MTTGGDSGGLGQRVAPTKGHRQKEATKGSDKRKRQEDTPFIRAIRFQSDDGVIGSVTLRGRRLRSTSKKTSMLCRRNY